jgi:RNA polymerase sigma factor (sigma-70 family)
MINAALIKHCALKVAKSLPRHHCYTVDDLVNEGVIGLLRAQSRYDPTSGVKFETYAYPRIIGAMRDAAGVGCCKPYATLPERIAAPRREVDDFKSFLKGMSRRERLILTLRYCAELEWKEIARAIGYSVRLIIQMHADLLQRLHERYLGSFPNR